MTFGQFANSRETYHKEQIGILNGRLKATASAEEKNTIQGQIDEHEEALEQLKQNKAGVGEQFLNMGIGYCTGNNFQNLGKCGNAAGKFLGLVGKIGGGFFEWYNDRNKSAEDMAAEQVG